MGTKKMTAIAAVRIVKLHRQAWAERLSYSLDPIDRRNLTQQVRAADRLVELLADGRWQKAYDLLWDRSIDLDEVGCWLEDLIDADEEAALEAKEARR